MTVYAYNPDPEDESKAKLNISDARHTAAAVAALGPGYRGNKVQIPESDLPAVKRKVRAAYKKFYPDNELPDILKASEFMDMFSVFVEKVFGGSSSSEAPVEELNEEMVSYEVVYEPMVKDAHGEWMTEATIADACDNFNHYLEKGVVNANLFHLKETDAFTIESTWVQKEFDVKVIQTGEVIKAGTWVAKLKYNDETLWDLKKQGILGGVSIGGRGVVNQKTGEITNVTFDGEDN